MRGSPILTMNRPVPTPNAAGLAEGQHGVVGSLLSRVRLAAPLGWCWRWKVFIKAQLSAISQLDSGQVLGGG
jgi:hypothetical protein